MKTAILLMSLLMTTGAFAGTRACKSNYKEISCKGIKKSQRSHFCTKRSLSKKQIANICIGKKNKRTRSK